MHLVALLLFSKHTVDLCVWHYSKLFACINLLNPVSPQTKRILLLSILQMRRQEHTGRNLLKATQLASEPRRTGCTLCGLHRVPLVVPHISMGEPFTLDVAHMSPHFRDMKMPSLVGLRT